MRRWQIGSQVPLLHIGPCSPFSLTRAARNLESFPLYYTQFLQISLRHQANTPVPDLPFPLHGTSPGAPSTPSLLILCMLILS